MVALLVLSCSGLWRWVEIEENTQCKSVTRVIIAQQSKVSPLAQSFWRLGGMEFLLEICRMLLAFGSGKGDGSVLCPLPGITPSQKQKSELFLMTSLR